MKVTVITIEFQQELNQWDAEYWLDRISAATETCGLTPTVVIETVEQEVPEEMSHVEN